MHDSKLIFVRAATFGQLAERIFDHESSSLPRKACASPVTADNLRLHFREQIHR